MRLPKKQARMGSGGSGMKDKLKDFAIYTALVAVYLWFTLTSLGCHSWKSNEDLHEYGAKASTIKLIPKSCVKHGCYVEVFKQYEPDAVLVLNNGDWLVRWDKWLDFEWVENEQ